MKKNVKKNDNSSLKNETITKLNDFDMKSIIGGKSREKYTNIRWSLR